MKYDVGIIGAGLAGLSLAIQLSRGGHAVAIFEKSKFPFHKLCGEYLSNESLPFLDRLGLNYGAIGPAKISRLYISNASGKELEEHLGLGGIGISRWRMDEALAEIATDNGAILFENTLVQSTHFVDNVHHVKTKNSNYKCDVLISAFGKKSNLSKINKPEKDETNQYLGIKYHAKLENYPSDLISMHNFKDGYCGVCRLEGDWVSICYLSHTNNLKQSGNSIKKMEEEVLFKNVKIKDVFERAEFLYTKPIAVSNIEFKKKELLKDDVIYVGDAAGLITPLCGNGMSMSLHASAILGPLVSSYLCGELTKSEMYLEYSKQWNKQFKVRMSAGRKIQSVFRNQRTADIGLTLLNLFPFLKQRIIKLTHGKAY